MQYRAKTFFFLRWVDRKLHQRADDRKYSNPLSTHGNTRSDQLPLHNLKASIIKRKGLHGASLYVLSYFGNKVYINTLGHLFKQTHLFHRKLGKVEQESLFDKLNSLNCTLKHSVGQLQSGASPPVLSSIEERNCRSFIHHCQQTRFLRDASQDTSVSNSAPLYNTEWIHKGFAAHHLNDFSWILSPLYPVCYEKKKIYQGITTHFWMPQHWLWRVVCCCAGDHGNSVGDFHGHGNSTMGDGNLGGCKYEAIKWVLWTINLWILSLRSCSGHLLNVHLSPTGCVNVITSFKATQWLTSSWCRYAVEQGFTFTFKSKQTFNLSVNSCRKATSFLNNTQHIAVWVWSNIFMFNQKISLCRSDLVEIWRAELEWLTNILITIWIWIQIVYFHNQNILYRFGCTFA